MKPFLKSLRYALGAFLIAGAAMAANIAYRTGPVDTADLRGIVNTLVRDINAGTAGLLYVNGTSTANAGTSEATIYTYTLPPAYLAVNGQSIRVRCAVSTSAAADAKNVKLYFGATSNVATGSVNNNAGGGFMEYVVTRTGAATQTMVGYGQFGVAGVTPVIQQVVAATETLSGAVEIKCTGTDGTTGGTTGKLLLVETIR